MGTIKRFIILCVIFSGMSLVAFAAEERNSEESVPLQAQPSKCLKMFTLWDEDGDKKIASTEFLKNYDGVSPEAVFASRDKNRDGALAYDEFCGGRGKLSPRMP